MIRNSNEKIIILIFLNTLTLAYSFYVWIGTKTINWNVSDADGDPVTTSFYYSVTKEGPPEIIWELIAKNLSGSSYEFDTTTIPNGTYYFRLVFSDRALKTENVTEKPIDRQCAKTP